MDFVSHALMGMTLYQAGKPCPHRRHADLFWVMLIGSEMPDLDILFRIGSSVAYLLNHRGVSHSLPVVLAMSAMLACYLRRFHYPKASFRRLFGWGTLAGLLHIFVDALNTWGTQIWFPFSDKWVTWDILPFIDPLLILLCGVCIAAGRLQVQDSRRYAVVALLLLTLYGGSRYMLHEYFLCGLQIQYACSGVQKISVLPTIHPLHWEAVLETRSAVVFGNINAKTMQVDCTAWYPTYEDPLLTECRSQETMARSLPFFRYPALSLRQEAEKKVIIVSDLYFGTNMNRRATFELRGDGSVKEQRRIKPIIFY